MWTKIVSTLLGAPVEHVADFFKQRQKLKTDLKLKKLESKIKIEEAKANRAIKELDSDSSWELAHIKNSGWKDEWVLILLSIPLVGSFIPGFQAYIMSGFAVLANTPEWYRWLIVAVFSAIYGIRIWRRK